MKPWVMPAVVVVGGTAVAVGYYLFKNKAEAAQSSPGGAVTYGLPLDFVNVTSPFGPRTHPVTGEVNKMHQGIDFGAGTGTPVYAVADGKVDRLDYAESGGNNGNAVFQTDPAGRRWAYLHLSKFHVSNGDTVKKGQIVGEVGATGRVTGPHLHLQVYNEEGEIVDPATYLPSLVAVQAQLAPVADRAKKTLPVVLAVSAGLGIIFIVAAATWPKKGEVSS